MEVISLRGKKQLNTAILLRVVDCLKRGGVVMYPTDTAYGLGADWTNKEAVKKIFMVKRRPNDKKVPVIVSGIPMAKQYVQWEKQAQQLADRFWPGALTIVLPLRSEKSEVRSQTVGVRIPDHPIALQIVKALNRPIVSTSANIFNEPLCYSLRAFLRQMRETGDRGLEARPDIMLDVGALRHRKPSTVVACLGQSMRILRQGSVRID